MELPKISIILPTYNGTQYITNAIESVLLQTFADWELLIIDDGSTDDTASIAKVYAAKDQRIIFVQNQYNLGIQKTLNNGLAMARGEYVARLDDDDRWIDSSKLDTQVTFLDNHSDYVLVGTNAILVDEKGARLATYSMPETDSAIRGRLLSKNCFLHPTIMMRIEALKKSGGYDENENVRHIEDYALWLALGMVGKFANIPLVSTSLTAHSSSITFKNRLIQAKRVKRLACQYHKKYPRFLVAMIILQIRIVGFSILSVFPIPKKIVYFIQKTYKRL